MSAKFVLTLLTYTVAAACFIGSAPSPVLKYQLNVTTIDFSLWERCTQVAGLTTVTGLRSCVATSNSCEKFMDVINAGRAFIVVSCVVVGTIALLAFARAAVPAKCQPFSLVFVLGGLFAICSGVISWGSFFALYDADFCGTTYKDIPAIKIGAAGPLAFVGWCLVVLAWFAELMMCCGSTGGDSEPAPENAPDAVVAEEKKVEETNEEAKVEETKAEAKAPTPKADAAE